MWNSEFDLAIARLCFLQSYIRWMKSEVNMNAKHEREPEREVPQRRRFWHRRPAAPAQAAQAKKASGKSAPRIQQVLAAES